MAWALPGWLGRHPSGCAWAQGWKVHTLSQPANLPCLESLWARPVFHDYDHLASVLHPQLGTKDVIWRVEALTNYTKKGLNNSCMETSLSNTEVTPMRKAVLQNHRALDTLTAACRRTGVIIKNAVLPEESDNISKLMTDTKTQITNLSDQRPTWKDGLHSWLGS